MDFKEILKKIEHKEQQKALHQSILEELKIQEEENKLNKVVVEQAYNIIHNVNKDIQQKIHSQISSIVSSCLNTIFGEDAYEFEILFVQERNKTTAKLLFKREGQYIEPLLASGGGAIDIASFALRTSALILGCSRSRRLMILDEPFRFVSEEYRKNISTMLNNLSDKFSIQFIIVTHIKELMIGKTITIS